MKSPRTWVLIADGGRARLVEASRGGSAFQDIEGMAFENDLPASRDILSDRPGRTHESVGTTRHAMENPADPHRELKRGFAKKLAETVDEALQRQSFDRLVVVAPPTMMGDLRTALSARTKSAVYAEVTADLTNTPNIELPKHLADAVK